MTDLPQHAESTRVYSWCVFIDGYPWTEGGTSLKAWRTPEEARADAVREWGDAEVQVFAIVLQSDGLEGGDG